MHDIKYAKVYAATDGVVHRLVALHHPVNYNGDILCDECSKSWPCLTFVIIEESS